MTQAIRIIIGLVVVVFGSNVASFAGNDAQSYKYGGKELYRMEGMNLYDFHARSQSATTLTFTTPDPKLEDYPGISPYAYCAGNPIMLIDPTGMDWVRAEYKGEYFFFYDENIKNENDVMKKWGNATDVQYVGKENVATVRSSSDKDVMVALNKDGSYSVNGESQNEIYDKDKVHVGNASQLKDGKYNSNWHGSYLGPNNPESANGGDAYCVPPTDYADYAAFQHDKDYDNVGVRGD